MKKKPQKVGRPRFPKGATRSVAISVRMTPAEHTEVVRSASAANRKISDHFVMSVLGGRFSSIDDCTAGSLRARMHARVERERRNDG